MADLGFGSRAELVRYMRQNLAPDAPTIGRSTVRAYNLYLPAAYVASVNVATVATVNKTVSTFTLSKENKYDNNASMWDPANPDRLTVQQDGWYEWGLTWAWQTIVTGTRTVWTTINGVAWDQDDRWPDNNGRSGGTIAGFAYMPKGTYLGAIIFQDSAGAMNMNGLDMHLRFYSN